jgi:hypothetical protein
VVENANLDLFDIFNSLSRDHIQYGLDPLLALVQLFQLPLSGSHSVWVEDGSVIVKFFSTPSLGITEPDSGIFQLSAAFCRGAPSHK